MSSPRAGPTRRSRKVLHPATKKKLFRHGNEKEGEQPREQNPADRGDKGVQMEEANEQSEPDSDRRVRGKGEQANAEIVQAQTQVEADISQLPDSKKTINTGVQEKDLIEDGEARAPRRLKPTQIDRETEYDKDQKVTPFSTLLRVGQACFVEQQTDAHRQQRVEGQPGPAEKAARHRDKHVGETEQGGRQYAQPDRQLLRQLETAWEKRC